MKSTLKVKRKTAYFYTLAYLLSVVFSLTFMYPYSFNKYHTWLVNNSTIDGKELELKCRTKKLYFIYFTGILIALAIYGAYIGLYTLLIYILASNQLHLDYKLMNTWSVKIVSLLPSVLIMVFINSRFYNYKSCCTHFKGYDDKSYIKLQIYKIVISSILTKLIILATTLIGYPFALNIRERFLISRRYVDDKKIKFNGNLRSVCFTWYFGFILSIFTLGLYLPWLFFKLNKYIITNTVLDIKKDNLIKIENNEKEIEQY